MSSYGAFIVIGAGRECIGGSVASSHVLSSCYELVLQNNIITSACNRGRRDGLHVARDLSHVVSGRRWPFAIMGRGGWALRGKKKMSSSTSVVLLGKPSCSENGDEGVEKHQEAFYDNVIGRQKLRKNAALSCIIMQSSVVDS